MKRLNALMLNNNKISRCSNRLSESLSQLSTLVLTNNRIAHLSSVQHLSNLTKLEFLSLLENPVASKPYYRMFTIHCHKQLKWLDFRKVTQSEREEAKKWSKSAEGKAFMENVKKEEELLLSSSSSHAPNGKSETSSSHAGHFNHGSVIKLTEEQKNKVKLAIQRASSKAEIDEIESQLKVSQLVRWLVDMFIG